MNTRLLETQADFEALWTSINTDPWIVYFTAAWCKACKSIDIEEICKSTNIPVYKCDESQNTYTIGYCGIRKFPTFVCYKPGKIISTCQSNNMDDIFSWIKSLNE